MFPVWKENRMSFFCYLFCSFRMEACLAILGITAAFAEDEEETEGDAYGLDLQVNTTLHLKSPLKICGI